MKKLIAIIGASFFFASLFAGGIDNKTNLNSGYLRNPSRLTETKRPEAVLYNIAGTGFMEEGLYMGIGNQFIFKKYTNELKATGKEYSDNKNVFFFPDLEIVYKKDNWAAFFGFGVFAGGGSLDYSDGNGAIAGLFAKTAAAYSAVPAMAAAFAGAATNHSLKVYSATMGEILGASYVVNDMVSLSLAARFLHGNQNISLKAPALAAFNGGKELAYDASGYGLGGIIGINVIPMENLYLGLQYQTVTKLDYKYKSITGSLTPNILKAQEGDSFDNDLPAVLGLGAGYNVLDNLYVSLSFNYYFNKQADLENPLGRTSLDYDDSWEVGLGADYQFNEKLGFSAGLMYSNQGSKSDVNSAFSPVLDSIVMGCGVEYKVIKNLMLTGSFMYSNYFEKEYANSLDLNKDIFLTAISVTYRPL
ncbi:outer membrane protein transport protein [Treponema parvum]|uniref:Outer membrane protein transport protein n=1 Tax=Treponema parvum TaxID=138851 RepID=A0A975F4P1_9SPIR|nr:outer membrane protein transport protein [Treponema parvum]QTQ14346.1 outer membrane protein transport protein [Treponema parvum]